MIGVAIAFILVSFLVVLLAWRLVVRADPLDRILHGAAAGDLITFLLALAGAWAGSNLYYDAALGAALLSFVATVAATRYHLENAE